MTPSQRKEKHDVLEQFCKVRYRYRNANDLHVELKNCCDSVVDDIKRNVEHQLDENKMVFFLSSSKFKDYLSEKLPMIERICFAKLFPNMANFSKFIHSTI